MSKSGKEVKKLNEILTFIGENESKVTQVIIGIMVLLFFVVILSFIRKNKFKDTSRAKNESNDDISSLNLISPAEYLKKCVNAAARGTVPFDIADDFIARLGIAERDKNTDYEFKDAYSDIFYSWFNSTMGLINRYDTSDDEDICQAINSMIVADEDHSEYIDKMFRETQTAGILSGELPFTEVCNWRKSFVNYEDVQKGRFQRFLSLQFMRFVTGKPFECPECLCEYDSSFDEDNTNSIMEFLSICSRPRIEASEKISNYENIREEIAEPYIISTGFDSEDISDMYEPVFDDDSLEDEDSFFSDVTEEDVEENLTADIESNEDSADRLTAYESFFDSDTEADSIEEIKDISFSEEKISPPPDTFTLSVDPESISEPCEKKGKILRRIKIPNPKGEEDRLRDSIIVYGDQVEDTGQGFCLVTLPAEGERTLYKSRVVSEVLGKPVYENIKEIVSNLSIKDRFNDYYVSQLGAG